MSDDYMESNRLLWDERTDVHESSDFYDLKSFIAGDENPDDRRGPAGVRLRAYEIEEIGDVTDKMLLHLQCHFGIDTLSWARLGATATGVDFSANAIALARRVAKEVGIDATFIESNVYDLPDKLDETFDVVYTSRGVISWLPDIEKWAEVAAHFVRPGGIFYINEGHPVMWVFDDEDVEPGELRLRYPYFSKSEPIVVENPGTYTDKTLELDAPREYSWSHGLGEIVTALARAGLRIESLREYPWVEWPTEFLQEFPDGTYRLPEGTPAELPLFFSIKATKPL